MEMQYTFELMEAPEELAGVGVWTEEVYRDLLACQQGTMNEEGFRSKYLTETAILCLDMTGFTISVMERGELHGLLRILDVQKICGPIFLQFGALLIRAFADNFTVLFDDPNRALEAAFEVHRRIRCFCSTDQAGEDFPQCCIGIGYGKVYAIGPNRAMGCEMNRAAKLAEDTARGFETLITESAYDELKRRDDCVFKKHIHEENLFDFYDVQPRGISVGI